MSPWPPTTIVVGTGPAGAFTALLLARQGFRVELIGPFRDHRLRAAEVLAPRGQRLLEQFGLWSHPTPQFAKPCHEIVSAWEAVDPTARPSITNPYGAAWHVDREQFDAWLIAGAVETGARRVDGRAVSVRRVNSSWTVHVRTSDRVGRSVTGDFLVLAAGQACLDVDFLDRVRFDTLCMVGGVFEASSTSSALLVESTANGWWYSAPTGPGTAFAGWITDAFCLRGQAYGASMDRALATATLTRARVGKQQTTCSAGITSAACSPGAGEGWIAVGDAALAPDPLSGQGLTHALQSGCRAAEAIDRARSGDSTVWAQAAVEAAAAVRRYQATRRAAYRLAGMRWQREPFWTRRTDRARV